MTETTLHPDVDEHTDLEHGQVTHIVRREPGEPKTAVALVMEARVNGTPLEALCGHRFVPSKDPKRFPLCEACRQIYELHGDMGDAPRGHDPRGLPT